MRLFGGWYDSAVVQALGNRAKPHEALLLSGETHPPPTPLKLTPPSLLRPWGDFQEDQAFTGLLDELRVWTVARTSDEIASSYLEGIEVAPPSPGVMPRGLEGLHFYWKFDEPGESVSGE